ncbi:MAG: DUF2804 domain-containing protein [Treponema sp.]|nr:DUF2804 domain-containing protein [Treponema sp.]
MEQKEIITVVPVLNESGTPDNFGWARFPAFAYDPAQVLAPRRAMYESDRYVIFSPSHMLITEIMDYGYVGYAEISIVSLKDKNRYTQNWNVPFPLGCFELPRSSEEGQVRIQTKKYFFNFAPMENGVRIVKLDIPRFGHHKSLRGELVLTPLPGAETLAINMPWREKKLAFRCACCTPAYRAEGVILYGTQELIFGSGNSWGIFDWNRGVKPRSDVHVLASACGKSEEHQAGFIVGYNSTDSAFNTENAFFLDGKIHKLDQVTFQISPSSWLLPWHFTSNDGRLEMVFTPHQEMADRMNLFFSYIRRRQVFGTFAGKVILDDGSGYEFKNITGFAERIKTRF